MPLFQSKEFFPLMDSAHVAVSVSIYHILNLWADAPIHHTASKFFCFLRFFCFFFVFALFTFFDWDGICDNLKAVLRSIFKIWMLLLLLSNFVSSYIDDASLIYIVFTWFIFRHKSKKFSIPMDKYRWVSSHCECLFDLPN